MSFSYSAAQSSTRDKLRGRIGDVTSARHFLDDSTLDAILTIYSDDPVAAAPEACRQIIAKAAKDHDRSGVELTASRSQVVLHYERLLDQLVREAAASGVEMFVGGTMISETTTLESNTDLRARTFKIGMDDYP